MDLSAYKRISINGIPMKKITLGGVVAWKRPAINQVPLSIDTDGSIFNGKGYIEGYRLSSSGSLSAQDDTITTGFIPCKAGDVIRMSGVSWRPLSSGFCYLMFFKEDFSVLGSVNEEDDGANYYRGNVANTTAITTADGITTFQPVFSADAAKVAYFRINGYGAGADMVVTVNEEIG